MRTYGRLIVQSVKCYLSELFGVSFSTTTQSTVNDPYGFGQIIG